MNGQLVVDLETHALRAATVHESDKRLNNKNRATPCAAPPGPHPNLYKKVRSDAWHRRDLAGETPLPTCQPADECTCRQVYLLTGSPADERRIC